MHINQYIAKQFKKPTGFGGKMATAIMNWQNYPLYEATERLLLPDNHEKILDIGCGNGYVLTMLAKKYHCEYTGIDISTSILKAAAKRNRKFVKAGNMSFEYGEANKMNFEHGTFNKAYTINTVYFWDDLADTMHEIKRILKPRGTFINTLYTNEALAQFPHTQFGYKRFTIEALVCAAEDAGFKTKVVPITEEKAYCMVCDVV